MQDPTPQTPPPGILGPPEAIDAATLAFCASISPHAPLYVPAVPAAHARVAYCFDNSVTQAAAEGGEAAYGWAIWRWPGRWFEAEHHAVWRRPDGSLLDVTPQLGAPERVLFLPDPEKVFDPERYRRNIMAPDGDNPLAADYIDLVRQRTDITDRYWYPGVEILPLFSPEDQARIAPIDARMAELRERMAQDPSEAFVASISQPGHALHAAWRELNRPIESHSAPGLVGHKEMRTLLATLRRDHPALLDRLDPRRIALWEPRANPVTRGILAGLAVLILLCIGYLIYEQATRPPAPPPIVVSPTDPLTNQRVDTDRALETIFGDQVAIADLEARNPGLAVSLQKAWSDAYRRGVEIPAFAEEIRALVDARYRAGVRSAAPDLLLEYHRLMLDMARTLRGLSAEDCAGLVTGQAYDGELVPADLVRRDTDIAARILPDARNAIAPEAVTMPAPLNAAAARRANLSPAEFGEALGGRGSPEALCNARIGLLETLLEQPPALAVPLLRKI